MTPGRRLLQQSLEIFFFQSQIILHVQNAAPIRRVSAGFSGVILGQLAGSTAEVWQCDPPLWPRALA
jgi:hypothetical protein